MAWHPGFVPQFSICSTLANFQPNIRMLLCSAQLTDSAWSTFARLLPSPSCLPPHGATPPTQGLCSCCKVRKQLEETLPETFPYSLYPAAIPYLFPANWWSCCARACSVGREQVIATPLLARRSKQLQGRTSGSERLWVPWSITKRPSKRFSSCKILVGTDTHETIC